MINPSSTRTAVETPRISPGPSFRTVTSSRTVSPLVGCVFEIAPLIETAGGTGTWPSRASDGVRNRSEASTASDSEGSVFSSNLQHSRDGASGGRTSRRPRMFRLTAMGTLVIVRSTAGGALLPRALASGTLRALEHRGQAADEIRWNVELGLVRTMPRC
jgi:hypothetical protein